MKNSYSIYSLLFLTIVASCNLSKKIKRENENQQVTLNKYYSDLITKADYYFDAKQYDKAKIAYEEARNVKPSAYYAKEQILKIESIVSEEYSVRKNETIFTHCISKGAEYAEKKDYQKAIELYRRALRTNCCQTQKEEVKQKIEALEILRRK